MAFMNMARKEDKLHTIRKPKRSTAKIGFCCRGNYSTEVPTPVLTDTCYIKSEVYHNRIYQNPLGKKGTEPLNHLH